MNHTFGDRLKQIRLDRDMSQEELALLLGTSKQVISRYETNQRTPKITVANEYAEKLGVPLNTLLEESDSKVLSFPNIQPIPKMKKIPLLGTIACGEPILAEENYDGLVLCPDGIDADFSLRCQGDSMINARIYDGDIVYIRQQPDVDNGQIAAVLIGDEATLKRVYKQDGQITLMAENSAYPPFVYSGQELDNVRILGKAVAFMSAVR